MYDIRQFKPALYFLLLMGVTGFALASQLPGLWILAVTGITLNAWLVKTGRFVPMPRLAANAVTVLALAYVVTEVRAGAIPPILLIGEFLVLLHLIKLFEQRANRDYAQLLVLSLLLMVAAAISTASLLFGLLLFVYLFVSLYCCLLFHLKSETDAAKAALHLPEEKINPASLRQDQRRLAGSMRRLTGLVSSVAITMAALVFLFVPRGIGEGMLGRRVLPAEQILTGFSDRVSFQQVARITRNETVVAHVKVTRNGQPWGGTQPLVLRGMTLDVYSGDGNNQRLFSPLGPFPHRRSEPWQWYHSSGSPEKSLTADIGQTSQFRDDVDLTDAYVQDVNLEPTGTHVLFAMAGAASFKSSRDMQCRYFMRDGVLEDEENLDQSSPLQYTVVSTGVIPVEETRPPEYPPRFEQVSKIDPRIEEYARRPEVSGVDGQGRSLAALRGTPDAPPDIDERIARAIEHHLQTEFKYTLDLTDARNIPAGEDPMVAFLYDLKRGHCEYFAGAMTLMCQSLGMRARMIVGFHSDEFNTVGQFYIVRQSHAHAWVEVLTPGGWLTFDPTSSQEAAAVEGHGLLAQMKGIFDYLDYKWGLSVVAYGKESRENLVQHLDTAMNHAVSNGGESVSGLQGYLKAFKGMIESSILIGGLITLMVVIMIVLVAWFIFDRLRLLRRARRIGLTNLPLSEKERLARQLGFYDDLLRLLERHKISRARHLTPLEFSDTLSFLPREAYDHIRRLTELFYRIRYGQAELNTHRRRKLATVIARLEQAMAAASRP